MTQVFDYRLRVVTCLFLPWPVTSLRNGCWTWLSWLVYTTGIDFTHHPSHKRHRSSELRRSWDLQLSSKLYQVYMAKSVGHLARHHGQFYWRWYAFSQTMCPSFLLVPSPWSQAAFFHFFYKRPNFVGGFINLSSKIQSFSPMLELLLSSKCTSLGSEWLNDTSLLAILRLPFCSLESFRF